jgi:sigma-B regulation protein RsbU (phosphoserine phosphatase)
MAADPEETERIQDNNDVPHGVTYDQLRRAVEQTADSILITDSRGILQYVNPAFERTTGYSAREVLGRSPGVLKSGKHDAQFYRDLWSKLLAGESFRGVIVNRKKSGELYWAEQTISPIRNDSGVITHFVSVLNDVTLQRQQQEQEFHLELAREVQQRYYNTAVSLDGFDIAGAAYPADQTGGDYFDFIERPEGSLYLVIADVTGHGFGSALVMAETRATLRAFAAVVPDIGTLLKHVNRSLAATLGGSRLVTMLLCHLDPRKRLLEYASAGHEPGYVLRLSGEVGAVMGCTEPPLGLSPDQEFHSGSVIPLEDGDTIALLTDGITESADAADVMFGADRALDFIRSRSRSSARELVQGLYEAARTFAGSEPQLDDITSVICKVGSAG